jgi:hypothetical protein
MLFWIRSVRSSISSVPVMVLIPRKSLLTAD